MSLYGKCFHDIKTIPIVADFAPKRQVQIAYFL